LLCITANFGGECRSGSKAAQTISASRQRMSASPQKRTYASLHRDVRFVP
jgi:hypothetical protein